MARTPSTMLELGTQLPQFTLNDAITNATISSSQLIGKPILVVFLCNHCPFVLHLLDGLTEFFVDYSQKLHIVAINSNDVENYPQDGPQHMKSLAEERQWDILFLLDESQEVAQSFRAACTPDFFLFNEDQKLVYRGQFDSSRPGNNVPVTGANLRNAAKAVLSGENLTEEQIPSLGCNIKWIPGREPNYLLNR